MWASVSMYSSEIPTKPQGTLTHPLMLANPALSSHILAVAYSLSCWLPCSASFSWLSASPDFSWLPCSLPSTSVDSPTFVLSSSPGLMGNLVCKPFVWVSCQNRQRNLLTGTYPHPHNECPTSCHTKVDSFFFSESLSTVCWGGSCSKRIFIPQMQSIHKILNWILLEKGWLKDKDVCTMCMYVGWSETALSHCIKLVQLLYLLCSIRPSQLGL